MRLLNGNGFHVKAEFDSEDDGGFKPISFPEATVLASVDVPIPPQYIPPVKSRDDGEKREPHPGFPSREPYGQQKHPCSPVPHPDDREILALKKESKRRAISNEERENIIQRLNALMVGTGRTCRTCFNALMPQDRGGTRQRCFKCRSQLRCFRCNGQIRPLDNRCSLDMMIQASIAKSKDFSRTQFTCSDCSQYCRVCMIRFRSPVYHELVTNSICKDCKGVKHFGG
eukprot:GHVH01002425.1.p1 GENE.GHVH01002425.1~~GHVH01002425.1.p1  ORF type:complete len:228 (-),score=17.72 GHVH01002425.1:8-691(-)